MKFNEEIRTRVLGNQRAGHCHQEVAHAFDNSAVSSLRVIKLFENDQGSNLAFFLFLIRLLSISIFHQSICILNLTTTLEDVSFTQIHTASSIYKTFISSHDIPHRGETMKDVFMPEFMALNMQSVAAKIEPQPSLPAY